MTNWVTCNTPSLLTIPFAIALHNSCAGIGQIIAQWIWKADEAEAAAEGGTEAEAKIKEASDAIARLVRS